MIKMKIRRKIKKKEKIKIIRKMKENKKYIRIKGKKKRR